MKKKSDGLKVIKASKKSKDNSKKIKKFEAKEFPSLNLKTEADIALDFATKAYEKFNKIVKSIILFGSSVKQDQTTGSDIDLIIVIDDASIVWDQELIAWYREELEKILQSNPYNKSLHINTIKLTTWWEDLLRGDPTLINIIRYGEPVIDFAGFFDPIKFLLLKGKIKATPEAIYSALQRAPMHLARSRAAELGSIEGLFWSMVDASHAALISAQVSPPSPEHIPGELRLNFVDKKMLHPKYALWYQDLLILHKRITHGETKDLKGIEIDQWRERAEEFLRVMAELVDKNIEKK